MLLSLLALAQPLAVVVPAPASSDRPLPLCCGIFAATGLPRPEAPALLRDGRGAAVPVVVHRERGRRILHGILPAGPAGPRRLWPWRERSRPAFPPLRATESSGVWSVDTGAWRCVAGPGPRIRIGCWEVRLPCAARGSWRLDHACSARVDLLFAGRSDDGLDLELCVGAVAGLARLDLAIHVSASERRSAHRGATVALETHGSRSLALLCGGGEERLAADATDIVLDGAEDGWWRGTERLRLPDPTGFRFGAGEGALGVAAPPGRGAGAVRVALLAGGREARLGFGLETLDAGQGHLYRLAFSEGAPPAPAPLVIPAHVVRKVGGGTALRSPDEAGVLTREVGALLGGFLAGSGLGLITFGPAAGDWRMDRRTVGNLEYDTVLGLLQYAFVAQDATSWLQARASADHLLGWDRDRRGTGLFFAHGRDHRSAPPECGHQWVSGLMLLDAWEGDLLRRRALERVVADQLEALETVVLERELPRSLGWGLQALLAGARSGHDPRGHRREIRRWRRHLLTTQTPRGFLRLARLSGERDLCQLSPMVQGGIIAPALARSADLVPDDRVLRAARRLARALARDAVFQVGDEHFLARRLVLGGRDDDVVGRSGRCEGEAAALFLAGLAETDPSLRSMPALRALRRGLPSQLLAHHRRFIGRELSLLLRSLPELEDW